jgi:hypothetical protein
MKRFLVGILIFLCSISVMATITTVRGIGSVSYSYWVKKADKEKALHLAQLNAVANYFAEKGRSENTNSEAIEGKINANLDQYIVNSTIVDEQDKNSNYTVVIRADLNSSKIDNELTSSSAVSQASSGQRSSLVYVFLGRQIASTKSFDDRVFKRSDASAAVHGKEAISRSGQQSESIKNHSVATKGSKTVAIDASVNSSETSETGGSTTQKADDTTYRLLPMADIKTSITSVFSQGNFDVVEPEFIVGDSVMKALTQEYSHGNDLTGSTMRNLVADLQKAQIPYLVLATLDVGATQTDEVTGLKRAPVTVTARVLDLTKRFPREVASVPAVQYFGVGPNNATAIEQALKHAALEAAKEVVSRLNAAGIK